MWNYPNVFCWSHTPCIIPILLHHSFIKVHMHSYAIIHLYVVPCQVKLHHALHHVVSCNLLLMSYLTRLGCVAVSKPCHLSLSAVQLCFWVPQRGVVIAILFWRSVAGGNEDWSNCWVKSQSSHSPLFSNKKTWSFISKSSSTTWFLRGVISYSWSSYSGDGIDHVDFAAILRQIWDQQSATATLTSKPTTSTRNFMETWNRNLRPSLRNDGW